MSTLGKILLVLALVMLSTDGQGLGADTPQDYQTGYADG